MLEIRWLDEAEQDLQRLYDFVVVHNPRSAKKIIQNIEQATELLSDLPYLGHKTLNGLDTRDFVVPFGKRGYILRYKIEISSLAIIRIWHTREQRN